MDQTARPVTVDLAGTRVQTWAYSTTLATPEIRVAKGNAQIIEAPHSGAVVRIEPLYSQFVLASRH